MLILLAAIFAIHIIGIILLLVATIDNVSNYILLEFYFDVPVQSSTITPLYTISLQPQMIIPPS